jgi:hypothetical protein
MSERTIATENILKYSLWHVTHHPEGCGIARFEFRRIARTYKFRVYHWWLGPFRFFRSPEAAQAKADKLNGR